MRQEDIRKIPKSDYLILPFIMVLAYYLAFIPRHSGPYLAYLDEWIHLAGSNQIISQTTTVGLIILSLSPPLNLGVLYVLSK